MQSLNKAQQCFEILQKHKAIDPTLFQVKELTSISDYFIISSGNSTRQIQAIMRHIQKGMRELGFRPYGIEGAQEGNWILMDYEDVIIHLFYKPFREFYDLEGLWVEAPRIEAEGG